jgi:hypothetical protein
MLYRSIISLFILAGVLALFACGNQPIAKKEHKVMVRSRKVTARPSSTSTSDAEKEAAKIIEKTVLACDVVNGTEERTLFFTNYRQYLIQLEGFTWQLQPADITEVPPEEKLKGVSWRGSIRISADASRKIDPLNNHIEEPQPELQAIDEFPEANRGYFGSILLDLKNKNGQWVCTACERFQAPDFENSVKPYLEREQ